jgi:hypothetical protein
LPSHSLISAQYAGFPEDEPIPEEDLDTVHNLQQELSVDIDWEIGDVLIIDVCGFCVICWNDADANQLLEFCNPALSLALDWGSQDYGQFLGPRRTEGKGCFFFGSVRFKT